VKDPAGSNSNGAADDAQSAAPARDLREERRWAREVLRRGVLELLYLGSNLAIAGGVLLWLYRLLTHKPALQTGLGVAAAVGVSLFAYHFARWRASAAMSRQVEKLAAWLIATFGMALVWGGICFAFTFGVLRWFSAAGAASWIIGGAAGLGGFAYMVGGERSELGACLALPAAHQNRRSDESAA
jgi:hypothetical protein